MTRKRFVKLAMASGYSRNAANMFAERVRANGYTYAKGYASLMELKKLGPALRETMQRASKVIGKMMKAVSEGVSAFSKAYTAAMAEE